MLFRSRAVEESDDVKGCHQQTDCGKCISHSNKKRANRDLEGSCLWSPTIGCVNLGYNNDQWVTTRYHHDVIMTKSDDWHVPMKTKRAIESWMNSYAHQAWSFNYWKCWYTGGDCGLRATTRGSGPAKHKVVAAVEPVEPLDGREAQQPRVELDDELAEDHDVELLESAGAQRARHTAAAVDALQRVERVDSLSAPTERERMEMEAYIRGQGHAAPGQAAHFRLEYGEGQAACHAYHLDSG